MLHWCVWHQSASHKTRGQKALNLPCKPRAHVQDIFFLAGLATEGTAIFRKPLKAPTVSRPAQINKAVKLCLFTFEMQIFRLCRAFSQGQGDAERRKKCVEYESAEASFVFMLTSSCDCAKKDNVLVSLERWGKKESVQYNQQ